jgi:amylosucrase
MDTNGNFDIMREAQRTLERLVPGLEAEFASEAKRDSQAWAGFIARLKQHFPRLFRILLHLYGGQYDFFYHLESLMVLMARSWVDTTNRPESPG